MSETIADLVIVPRRARDNEFVFQLSEQIFAPYSSYPRTTVAAMLAEEGAVTRIAEVATRGAVEGAPADDRRAGFFILLPRPLGRRFGPWENPASAYLNAIGVRESMRGRGVGRFLLEGAEQAARERRAVCMSLMTAESNARARKLFAARGYGPLFSVDRAYAGGQRGIVYFRPL